MEMVTAEESEDDYSDEDSLMSGHKIGGFPLITRYDPRSPHDSRDFLLLQLDSDYSGDMGEDGSFKFREKIMWGDAGVGHFFIDREALKLLDFSDVVYYWDNT